MSYQNMVSAETDDFSYNKKLIYALTAGVIFMLVSLPSAYEQTEKLTHTISDNCPTPEGKYLHAAVFFAVTYFVMKVLGKQKYYVMNGKTDGQIAKYAFWATMLFFVLASTDSYRLTGRLYDGLSNADGCPNTKGVVTHGVIFMIVILLTMYFPKDC